MGGNIRIYLIHDDVNQKFQIIVRYNLTLWPEKLFWTNPAWRANVPDIRMTKEENLSSKITILWYLQNMEWFLKFRESVGGQYLEYVYWCNEEQLKNEVGVTNKQRIPVFKNYLSLVCESISIDRLFTLLTLWGAI